MRNEMEMIHKRKIRDHYLRLLDISHPQATFESAAATGLITKELVTSLDISRYTDYLIERGYIRQIHEAEEYNIREKLLKLTDKGVDLLDGTISDPGVEV